MVFTLTSGVYLHTAYAQASDGSVGFSTESATDAAYLGQYTDASATDATDPSRYTWTPIDLGAGAELVEEDADEVDDGTDGLIDLLGRELYDTGQFAPDTQATGDRKVQTYFQAEEPNPEEFVFGVGDLWHDTDDGNHLYRWDGTAWADAQDGGIGAATELAQAVKEVLNGLTVEDEHGVTKINGGRVDTDNLFAQNIHIVSERVYDDTDEDGLLYQRVYNQTVIQTVQDENGVDYLLLKQAAVTDDYNDDPPVAANTPYRTDVNYGDGSYIKLANEGIFVHTPYILDVNGGTDTYTSFSGGVLSAGSLTVTKKLGTCWISGTVTLSKSISDWTTILPSAKVPAPQHGELVPFTVPRWDGSYVQPLRGKVLADGGLQLRLGTAKEYVFTLSYPID